ncbi:hypothetical protein GC173_14140 [bacterium]|nr:hypothetical protein [bacterium]
MSMKRWALALLIAIPLTGCVLPGSRAVISNRIKMNEAVQQSASEQLLLNLVRLRYRESTFFLEVASLTQGLEREVSSGASGSFPVQSPDSYGLNLGGKITDKPTIAYTPLQGQQYVTQLYEPVRPDTMGMLLNSGWSVARVFRVAVQEMNGLPNAPTASGPTPAVAPKYADFLRAVELMRALEIRDQLRIVYADRGGKIGLALQISEAARSTPEATELYALLGLDNNLSSFAIGPQPLGSAGLQITTRPLVSIFFYLSQGVEPPAKDIRRGYLTQTTSDSQPFDWTAFMANFFVVHETGGGLFNRPPRARIKTYYRGRWFYIDDADLPSKTTFLLLQQLIALQSGEIKGTQPVLTLPIGS